MPLGHNEKVLRCICGRQSGIKTERRLVSFVGFIQGLKRQVEMAILGSGL